MAKKKLLNEATVRRFMGLAGVESNIVSNKLTEMYGKSMEEDLYEEEEEEDLGDEEDVDAMGDMDAEPPADLGDEAEAEAGAGAGDLDMDQEQAQGIVDAIRALQPLADDLEAELGGEAGEEDDLEVDADLDAEEPEDMGDMDAEPVGDEDEVLEGVELQLSEDEIVQEVAKRVAKRILRAKKAKAQLDEALGRTKTRKRR